jgi:hypothetical protein
VIFFQGCAYQRTMRFASPSGKYGVEVWQTRLDNSWGAKLVLTGPGRNLVIAESSREANINFVHVYWSPDERLVGVVVTGLIIWHVAADTTTGRPTPFETMRDEVARSIRATYHVPAAETDPIGWAALNEAQVAFFKLHPKVRLTYH